MLRMRHRFTYQRSFSFFAVALTAFTSPAYSPAAYADSGVAIVIASTGNVRADTRKLSRRSSINEGDTITTGRKSKVEFKFSDGAIVSLKENSAFKINQYRFNQANTKDSYAVSLLKGGIKSVTGQIGKEAERTEAATAAGIPISKQVRPASYVMQTPVVTMGVRGTNYICSLRNNAESADISVYDGTVAAKINGTENEYVVGDNGYFAFAELSSSGFQGLTADPNNAADYAISADEEDEGSSAAAGDHEEDTADAEGDSEDGAQNQAGSDHEEGDHAE